MQHGGIGPHTEWCEPLWSRDARTCGRSSPLDLGGAARAVGQLAWTVENMYLNVFVYDTITDRSDASSPTLVAASAVAATLATLLAGAASDRTGRRREFIAVGYVLWGLSPAAFGLVERRRPPRLVPMLDAVAVTVVAIIALDCLMSLLRLERQRRRVRRLGHRLHPPRQPRPGRRRAGDHAAAGDAAGVRCAGRADPGRPVDGLLRHRRRVTAARRRDRLVPAPRAARPRPERELPVVGRPRAAAQHHARQPAALPGAGRRGRSSAPAPRCSCRT